MMIPILCSHNDHLTYFGRVSRECLGDHNSVMRHTLLEDILGGVPVLSEEEIRQPASLDFFPVAHRGLGLLSITILAPIVFLGSFALAAPALGSDF